MIKLGDYNTLKVIRRADQGFYLEGDEMSGDILLPNRYIPSSLSLEQDIEVFVYLDQDERLIATTEKPLVKVGEFASLEVAWINKYGAFLKWGLMKDLFCPFREQKQRMEVGKHYIVYVKEDEETHRLMATAKVDKYLSVPYTESESQSQDKRESQPQDKKEAQEKPLPLVKHGEACDCLIWQKTDLGFKTIVNNRYQGQVYDNQIFQPLHSGERITAYIDHVRQDGKIDLTLQPTGRQHTLDFAEVLLRYLYENDGHCDLGDKSPAELIYNRFKVSKKAYKKAIGDLYRRRLIVIEEERIRLV
ncbi:S1 RNA-binding domain-containing protein [Prevotella sp. E2-28]|uniref:CvfB family protein n=1 Tax=Prevotella sp. E2-28 TaxID=2913620 RepID=UPI001EDB6236|nr:S1-like domain-containing RNA-binding protein [Prevotella sp. E2-28]UKK53311.1 S1-like domain-containing RNA-binding protein [Prevotella sp. E2-28]